MLWRALQDMYQAATIAVAARPLAEVVARGARYPVLVRTWRANWARITPLVGDPRGPVRQLYTHHQRAAAGDRAHDQHASLLGSGR